MEVSEYPLVSVVTPSYNMAEFLEETIRSVLNQDYPRVEYIVMDGGSTDGTLEILRKYEGRILYKSQPDRGQNDAINRGFLQSRGRIFAFLNADDTYLPGAISTAVGHMLLHPDCAGIYGEGYLVAENGQTLCLYPTRDWDPELLKTECFICQPAVFLWSNVFADIGMMNEELNNAVDYDLWIRVAKRYSMRRVNEVLATSRMHRGAKTIRQRRDVYKSAIRVVKKHFGYVPYCHIYGYCCSVLDSRDGFFEPVPPSLGKYALSLGYGAWINVRYLPRFLRECFTTGVGALRQGAWPPRRGSR